MISSISGCCGCGISSGCLVSSMGCVRIMVRGVIGNGLSFYRLLILMSFTKSILETCPEVFKIRQTSAVRQIFKKPFIILQQI